MILKHFRFPLPDTLVICFMIDKRTFVHCVYEPSLICTVKNNVTDVTRYADQGFSSFPWIIIIQLLICFVYKYDSLQNYVISKLLRKHVLLFPKIFFKMVLQMSGAEMRLSNYLSFNLKIKKVIHNSLFKACTFYFQTKWLCNKV